MLFIKTYINVLTKFVSSHFLAKATNDIAQELSILNSEHVSSSLSTTIADNNIQRTPEIPIDREQGQETPDLGLCCTLAGSSQGLTSISHFLKSYMVSTGMLGSS
jgi:hypothetical protein